MDSFYNKTLLLKPLEHRNYDDLIDVLVLGVYEVNSSFPIDHKANVKIELSMV